MNLVRHIHRSHPLSLALACIAIAVLPLTVRAQDDGIIAAEDYLTPPEEIREAVLAPWYQNVELEDIGPAGRYFVIEEEGRNMPPLAWLARKHYNLGGVQIDPVANRARWFTTGAAEGYRLLEWRTGDEIQIEVPDDSRVSSLEWAPDGSRLAFFAHFEDATHIYVANPESGDSRRITETPVLATLVTSFEWSGDGSHILTVLLPEDRGDEPVEPAVAQTPRLWVTRDEKNVLRTYQSLLETPYQFALLEYYITGQLARIDVESDDIQTIGEPAMINGIQPSPSGSHVRVQTIERPLSDIVPVYRFAESDEIWNLEGDRVAILEQSPVRDGGEEEEDDGPERQEIAWRPDGRGLSFVQREPEPEDSAAGDDDADAANGGDAAGADSAEEDERPYRVMQWLPPFDSSTLNVVYETEGEIDDVAYSPDGSTLFITEEKGDREHLYAVSPDAPQQLHTIYRYDTEDFYADPGNLVMRAGPAGTPVVRVSPDGRFVYLSGTLYHEDPLENAPQPFLDQVEIETGEPTRIFLSAEDYYEDVEVVLDDAARRIVFSRESPTQVPNYFVRELETGDERQLTENRDYAPAITNAQRHVIQAERADGVMIQVEIALPADYESGTRLPAIFWHYPSEFESEEDYHESNRDYNKNRFPSTWPRSIEYLLLRGWAVVDADIPIIGDRRVWNKEYVPALRNSFAAAIAELVERGWIDRDRLAVGGHSYGGFGTLNAMIRTPFFQAGIAGAANSNRTLTPAGFQREQRTLWEGRLTYIRVSPMFWMDELNGALLLYHGLEDQNVGTWPFNSHRSYHALNALGKTAALYMYPYEGHGPRARESVLDLWARWIAWLDTHVLHAGGDATRVAEGDVAENIAADGPGER